MRNTMWFVTLLSFFLVFIATIDADNSGKDYWENLFDNSPEIRENDVIEDEIRSDVEKRARCRPRPGNFYCSRKESGRQRKRSKVENVAPMSENTEAKRSQPQDCNLRPGTHLC